MGPIQTDTPPTSPLGGDREQEDFKTAFQSNMICGESPILHEKVAVLMLSWNEANDDLSTRGEVDRLGNVFQDRYKFKVKKHTIEADGKQSMGVTHCLTGFLLDNSRSNDKTKALLIIYYAGHGNLGKQGELFLDGWSVTSEELKKRRNSVPWHSVEQNISSHGEDILVIFDCCHAGALARSHRGPAPYVFEYLAACGKDDLTPSPGDNSFTSALIWALETLDDNGTPFNSKTLYEQIKEAPNFSREQSPMLFERYDITNEHIWINSLNKIGRQAEDKLGVYPKVTDEFFDLRFHFNSSLDHEDAKAIAEVLSESIKRFPKKPRHVTMKGKTSMLTHFRWATDAFLRIREKKRKESIKKSRPTATATVIGEHTEAEALLESSKELSSIVRRYSDQLRMVDQPLTLIQMDPVRPFYLLPWNSGHPYISIFWTWQGPLVSILFLLVAVLLYSSPR